MSVRIFFKVLVCTILLQPIGCASTSSREPSFLEDQVPAIISSSDFDRIWNNLEGYKGMDIKLAGRIMDTSSTTEGAIILAAWFPYLPHFDLEDGPPDTAAHHGRHFVFFFPGFTGDPFAKGPDYDPLIAWEGNKFVMEGSIQGRRTMIINLEGDEQTMLFVRAQCIHVWETGKSEPSDQPDSQWPGQIARTFCTRETN